jgi:hypothetical protein
LILPDSIEEAMADIAFIFHWPLSEMDAMALEELSDWWRLAADRWKAANKATE